MSATTQFQDKTLTCRDCGNEFVWTADEQAFYQSKGFQNAPVRCPHCREEKRKRFKRDRELTTIVCAECGKEDTVPFKPKGDRPVLCGDCFKKHKEQESQQRPAQPEQPLQAEPQHELPVEEAPAGETPLEQDIPMEEEKAA